MLDDQHGVCAHAHRTTITQSMYPASSNYMPFLLLNYFDQSLQFLYIQSISSKGAKNYPNAKSYGKYSLLLIICNIIFTLCMALLITGLVVGCYGRSYYSNYYYSYSYRYYSNYDGMYHKCA